MKIVFAGTAEIAVPALRGIVAEPGFEVSLVITQPDRPVGRKQELHPSAVKAAAVALGLPIFQPEKLSHPDAFVRIAAESPDGVVVFAYGQILKKNLLELPPHGCVNVHASLLPRHRGASCIQAALMEGDLTTGVTIMKMDVGLDTGAVILQKIVPIFERDDASTLHDRLAEAAPSALIEGLHSLKNGTATFTAQDASLATYAPKLTRESGRIDWSKGSTELDRFIRAMRPWPSAFTMIEIPHEKTPKVLKVIDAIPSRRGLGKPGEILAADENGLLVAVGEGSLLIREVQLEGRKAMSTSDFLRGTPLLISQFLR